MPELKSNGPDWDGTTVDIFRRLPEARAFDDGHITRHELDQILLLRVAHGQALERRPWRQGDHLVEFDPKTR